MKNYKDMKPINGPRPAVGDLALAQLNRDIASGKAERTIAQLSALPSVIAEHTEHVAAIDLHDKINNRLVELFNSKSESDNNKYWNVRKMAYDRPDSPDDLVRMFTEGRL